MVASRLSLIPVDSFPSEFDGLKVFVDKTSLLYMDGVEVDYGELVNDAGFKFNNPNATGSCGCGSSFSV
jgi:iron-sulfur cluster assembly accessory protein